MNGYMSDPANGVAGKAILIEGAAYETVIQVLTNDNAADEADVDKFTTGSHESAQR